jgi:fructokinase
MNRSVALFGEVLADVFPDRSVLGGAPFNVARHLRMFGLNSMMITSTGNDELGSQLLAEMMRLGMDTSGVQCDPDHPTGQVIVHMDGAGHRFEILPDQAYDHIQADAIPIAAPQPALVYFGTLAQRCPESRDALDTVLGSCNSPRFLDINLRQPWYDRNTIERSLRRADILKINDEELALLAGMLNLPGEPQQHAAALIESFNLSCVLVTCGARGAWLMPQEGEEIRAGAKAAIPLADTVGAGDAFAAVFILGTLHHWPTAVTLNRANEFAAAICAIRGAAPDEDDFYAPFLRGWKL